MAKKTSTKKNTGSYDNFNGWANFTLGETDKKNIRSQVEDGLNPMPRLHELLEEGYTLKFAWDTYSDCPSVMLFGSSCTGDNLAWGMSCRHTDLELAVRGLLYQHDNLSGPDNAWPKPTGIRSEYDW